MEGKECILGATSKRNLLEGGSSTQIDNRSSSPPESASKKANGRNNISPERAERGQSTFNMGCSGHGA